MIQLIGIMVAFYILTRLSELIDNKKTGKSTKILSWISAIVTILCFFGLLSPGEY